MNTKASKSVGQRPIGCWTGPSGATGKGVRFDLMILGMLGVVGGMISMFAGSGPIGRPEGMKHGYDPSIGHAPWGNHEPFHKHLGL